MTTFKVASVALVVGGVIGFGAGMYLPVLATTERNASV